MLEKKEDEKYEVYLQSISNKFFKCISLQSSDLRKLKELLFNKKEKKSILQVTIST